MLIEIQVVNFLYAFNILFSDVELQMGTIFIGL